MKPFILFTLICLLASCAPSDAKLAENIKSNLNLIDSNIQVSVVQGVVTLRGEVADESVKNAAESSIREVKGVKSVVNNLIPKPGLPEMETPTRPDTEIREYVTAGLAANNIKGVTATVNAGEIILTGEARKADLQLIMRVASEAKAKNIKNQLKIK